MDYQLIRSSRKTLGLEIGVDGALIVRAPNRLSRAKIDAMLGKKSDWIKYKQRLMKERSYRGDVKSFASGESFLTWGQERVIKLVEDSVDGPYEATLRKDHIQLSGPRFDSEIIKSLLEAWYRRMTKEFVMGCVAYYQPHFQTPVNRIVVKDVKTRWGSCSSKNNLNFNWRLSMAPKEVVEYVVIHEMCHLVHMNHSKEFWDLVQAFMPNYKAKRQWLKEHGAKLYWQ